MRRLLTFTFLVFLWNQSAIHHLAAQDLVITNARIIVGNGTVINQGSVGIRGGRIVSVWWSPATLAA